MNKIFTLLKIIIQINIELIRVWYPIKKMLIE